MNARNHTAGEWQNQDPTTWEVVTLTAKVTLQVGWSEEPRDGQVTLNFLGGADVVTEPLDSENSPRRVRSEADRPVEEPCRLWILVQRCIVTGYRMEDHQPMNMSSLQTLENARKRILS